eukprot:gene57159-78325_t
MLADRSWRDSEAVRAASEIWSVRHPDMFDALRPRLALSHPELDDFCDNYTDGFSAFAAASGKSHRVMAASIHQAVDAALAGVNPEPYVVPSSGMVVVYDILHDVHHVDDRVILAGFGHVGWEGHPFQAERRLTDCYIAAGRSLTPMSFKMSRAAYASMFGPTTGDRLRLADTELFIEVEKDFTTYGEEVKFGGGKVIRDGMGQSQTTRADGAVDTVITNVLIVDAKAGIIKADVGLKDGKIHAI